MRIRPALVLLFVLVSGGGLLRANEVIPTKAVGPSATPVVAEHRIWGALVVATNATNPKDPPAELQDFAARLKRVFGYNQFELAGSAANDIDELTESWLIPSPTFWLSVKARKATSKETRGGYLLNLQLFQEKRLLVDSEAKLAPGSPLFIRGPQYGKGQVIIVLQVQH